MSILTAADIESSHRQLVQISKANATGGAVTWRTLDNSGGNPSALGLAPGNTANGIVPTDPAMFGAGGTAAPIGYPNVQFGSGNGYINWIEYLCNQAPTRCYMFDRVFLAGSYAFNAAVTLTSQPSFAARVPNGDYSGLQIWAQIASTITGTQNVTVTYTDQDGNGGATTGAIAMLAGVTGTCQMLPLAAGDSGVQLIETVTGTVSSVGTFNIFIARPLAILNAPTALQIYTRSFEQLCMPEIYPGSAIATMMHTNNTASMVEFEIMSK